MCMLIVCGRVGLMLLHRMSVVLPLSIDGNLDISLLSRFDRSKKPRSVQVTIRRAVTTSMESIEGPCLVSTTDCPLVFASLFQPSHRCVIASGTRESFLRSVPNTYIVMAMGCRNNTVDETDRPL